MSHSIVEIDYAYGSDVEAILPMGEKFVSLLAYQRAVGFDPYTLLTNLKEWVKEERSYVSVATVDKEIVGFMICFITNCPFADVLMAQEFAWWVEPEFRGLGIGKALKEHYTQWALQSGATSLSIGVANFTGEQDKMVNYLFQDGFELVDMSFIKRIQ